MPDLMQTLYEHVTKHMLDTYRLQTKYREYQFEQDTFYNKLWEQLTKEQRELLEEFDFRATQKHTEELYAMFLAAFDLSATLFRRHTA